jgi:hypothetical protein
MSVRLFKCFMRNPPEGKSRNPATLYITGEPQTEMNVRQEGGRHAYTNEDKTAGLWSGAVAGLAGQAVGLAGGGGKHWPTGEQAPGPEGRAVG